MADKSTSLILDALTKAMADPSGVPLHGTKKGAGLFATGTSAKQAAQRCLDDGYLRVLHRETKGKRSTDFCALTDKGLAYLLSQVSPKAVLEELVRTLQAQQTHVADLLTTTRRWQTGLDALQAAVAKVLQQIQEAENPVGRMPTVAGPAPSPNGSATLAADLLACLNQWQASGAPGDCPLPELYRRLHRAAPSLTIGRFHDSLRQMQEQQEIYLHPWSGPLYEIPEPPYALMVGHEVAYYASIRCSP